MRLYGVVMSINYGTFMINPLLAQHLTQRLHKYLVSFPIAVRNTDIFVSYLCSATVPCMAIVDSTHAFRLL